VLDLVNRGSDTVKWNARMARTIGLSIYEDLKLKKKEGESSGAVQKGAFKQLTGHVLANGPVNCLCVARPVNGP
jgi:hypothetical protein